MSGMNILRVAFTAFLLVLVSPAAFAQKQVPLTAYGMLPEVENAAISPSGQSIAVLLTEDGVRQFIFLNSEMQVFRRMGMRDIKVRYFEWVGEDDLLLVTSQTEDLRGFTTDKAEFAVAQLVPVTSSGPAEIIFSNEAHLLDSIYGNYGKRFIDGKWRLHFGALELKKGGVGSRLGGYSFQHSRPYLYAVDAEKNRATRLAPAANEGVRRDWLLDHQGEIVVRLDIDGNNGMWALHGANGSEIVSGEKGNGRVWLVGLGSAGKTVIYGRRNDEAISEWFEVPLTGGTPQPFLKGKDIDRLYFNDLTGQLMGYLDADEGPVFVDPSQEASAKGIRAAFADFDVQMKDWTPDFSKVLVRTSGNQDSGSWYVVDLGTGQAEAFAYERMAIGPEEVGAISTFDYVASDGLEMDGILTLPPGREAAGLPVVLLPHGGPHSFDHEQFDWWAQAFASRGYAVFQPNFRGSTHREQSFRKAGYGEWGRKMQTDISDGLAALAEKGIVDPSRACIVGASYGGYAALAGVTLQQDIYRCAVAVAPVSDLQSMYTEDYRASGNNRLTRAALLEQLGPREGWDDVSPRRHAERAHAPIMLIHGKDDTVVPYVHSHKMADALKDAGKPYELIALEGEDHWLSLSTTRLQMLEAAVGFVEKHNPAE